MKNEGIGAVVVIVIVIIIAVAAAVGGYFVLSGGEGEGEGYTGTGSENYSGTWSDSGVSGTWEFAVDWDASTVSGWFSGSAAGNVTGSVSPGEISAEGSAAWGLVSWSGTFTSDGSSVSGNWSCTGYSGTFSGTRST